MFGNLLNVTQFGTTGGYIIKTLTLGATCLVANLSIKCFTDGKHKMATGKIGHSLGQYAGTDGFILAKGKQVSFEHSCTGVLVVGPPGNDKTTAHAHPQLLTDPFPHKTSIVIHDAKGELYEDTWRFQKDLGRVIVIFSPLGGIGHYNPLEFCDTFSEVSELSHDLLYNGTLAAKLASGSGGMSGGDVTWVTMATPYLTMALLLAKELGDKYCNITWALRFLINNSDKEVKKIIDCCKNEMIIEQYNVFKMSQESGGTTGSIKSTLANNMALFLDPAIEEATSSSDFTPTMLRDKRMALYVQYLPQEAIYLSPLMSIFYSQLIHKAMKYYKHKNGIVWLLDEFQNLGMINGFPQIANSCREPNMAFEIFLQSISSLYNIYGLNGTKNLLNAFQFKCVLPSLSDRESLEYLSMLCGPTEVNIPDKNGGSHAVRKNLFERDEIRRIKSEHVLIIARNLDPLLEPQLIYFDNDVMLLRKYLGADINVS